MAFDKEKMASVLKKAIKSEHDGRTFYSLAVKKATNDFARKKLEQLRDDEVRHAATLEEMFANLIGGEIGELPEQGFNMLSGVFKSGVLDTEKTEVEIIDLAIAAELAATKFYDEQKDATDDIQFTAIFDKLAKEEYLHYELLKAERESLGGGYHWFSYGDSSPMED